MKKPNIIYVLADDLGYGDISKFNFKSRLKTPKFDELCNEGMYFTDAHATSAVCTPSRYSILTGRYNWRSRLKSSVLNGYSEPLIEETRMTIAHMLQANDYKTAAIGKWHLGMGFPKLEQNQINEVGDNVDYRMRIKQSPTYYGFDYFYGISASLDMPPYVYIENDQFTQVPKEIKKPQDGSFWREGPTSDDFVHEQVLDNLTAKVLDKIEQYKDQSFFIYFPLTAPHTPILPASKFKGKSNTNEYGDFVLHCDEVLGKINDKIKQLNLEQDTIIIFTSDNGCSPQADYEQLKKVGHNPSFLFRGMKSDIYEGGHRVPFIIKWPELIKPGTQNNNLIGLHDIYATLAQYLNEPIDEYSAEDSVSLIPTLIDNNQQVRENIICQSIDGSLSIRHNEYKLEMCSGSGGWSKPSPSQLKNEKQFQLYNLKNDIGENVNIIDENNQLYYEMRSLLEKQVLDGRSTPGPKQENDGEQHFTGISWIK